MKRIINLAVLMVLLTAFLSCEKYYEDTGTFTDRRDKTKYSWVKIGEQVWMAENLAHLPSVVGTSTRSYTDPYHYVYGYNGSNVADVKASSNYQTYGVLYNWPAALEACPAGWHLPTIAEWTELIDYLGDGSVAEGKLIETGTMHWNSPISGATNETGFTALPGGRLNLLGQFQRIGDLGYWWSATEYDTDHAWSLSMGDNVSIGGYVKEMGFSVRCVRD